MQLANCLVAIGGDTGNTVGKYAVTASEIAVLRAIHGEDSVTDIIIIGDEARSNRFERDRLMHIYGRAKDGNDTLVFPQLFPGVAARMFESIDELELHESFFKATSRATPRAAVEEEPVEEAPEAKPVVPQKPLTPAQKRAQAAADKKAQKAAAAAAVATAPPGKGEEDIEEMDDTTDVLS